MKKVAVTGSLSSGKSTVCRLLRERGAFVVQADEIVHQLLSPDSSIGRQVIELLGPDIVEGSRIDRTKVAKRVFRAPELLNALEQVIHPAVRVEIQELARRVAAEGKTPLFIAEIPLLYEAGAEGEFDATLVVTAPLAMCRERYKGDDFEARHSRQMAPEEKEKRADYLITNDGTLEELKTQVNEFFNHLSNEEFTLHGTRKKPN